MEKTPFASVIALWMTFSPATPKPIGPSMTAAPATGSCVFVSMIVPLSVAPLASFRVNAPSACGRRPTRAPRRAWSSCQSFFAWAIVNVPSSALLPTGRLSRTSSAPAAGVPSSATTRPASFTPGLMVRSGVILAASRIMTSLNVA